MKRRSNDNRAALRDKIIGLGEKSTRKSYYPELQQRLAELEEKNLQLTGEIEDRKRVEDALVESRERIEAIFEASPDPIVVYDTKGQVEYLNPAFQQVFGWTQTDLTGQRIPFVPPEEQEITRAKIKEIYATEQAVSFHTRRLTKDGNLRDILIRAAIIKGEGHAPTGMVVNLTDITETRRLEYQLQNAQRMESLGTLAGGIAHDFNNLLMGILGNATLMMHERESTDPEFEKLRSIEKYVLDGSKLTQQLLGVAKGGKYEVKPVDINEVIEKNSKMFGRTKKEIRIHRDFAADIWTVLIDRGQIEQVLLNLYVNAWQAMPTGGDLYLQTTNICYAEDAARGFAISPGNYVRISITDTGIGMDEDTRLRIFDPFYTTKQRGRGTGLGLASAYGIVKNHGGFITVFSRIDEGTTFNLFLPASDVQVVSEIKQTGATQAGSGTVLLVDDEEMILEVGREMLAKIGYKVLTADGGKSAIELYNKKKDSIDMVILDMIMPDMGGGEVYHQLKQIDPDVLVMLSSGYSINGAATDILNLGCNGFIQKPFNLQELSTKLKNIMNQT